MKRSMESLQQEQEKPQSLKKSKGNKLSKQDAK
jgi:hypothetical protein